METTRSTFAIASATAVIALLSGCGSGLNTVPGPEDEIVSIRNSTSVFAPTETQKDALPTPLPILEGEPPVDALRPEASAPSPRDVNTAPYDAAARLTFFRGNESRYCSAQFVGQSNVVLTAAHCVYDGSWNNTFRVRTKYNRGISEKVLDWDCSAIFSGWMQGKYQWDYAFIRVRGAGPNAMSFSNSGVPTSAESIGYPSNFDSGRVLHGVVGDIAQRGSSVIAMLGNPFGGGSSGGAWHVQGDVLSVNSHGYRNRPNIMFGPRFDGNVTRLYEFVAAGCPDASARANVKVAALRDGEGVIESNGQIRSFAPSLRLKSTEKCTCEADGIFLANELPHHYEVQLELRSDTESSARIESITSSPNSEEFLGCSAARSASKGRGCPTQTIATIVSASRIVNAGSSETFESFTLGDPAFCAARCIDGNSNAFCLQLGGEAASIAAPLAGFINSDLRETPDDEGVVSTIPEMIVRFGGEPDQYEDPCRRSDFVSNGAEIENSGLTCRVSVKRDNPLDLVFSLVNPPHAIGSPRIGTLQTLFERRTNAPQVEFLGENGDEITGKYGGKIVALEEIGSRLLITTENGCLSAEY